MNSSFYQFISDYRTILWMIFGAITMTVVNVNKIGFENFKRGNHPIQALIAMIVLGALMGMGLAWLYLKFGSKN